MSDLASLRAVLTELEIQAEYAEHQLSCAWLQKAEPCDCRLGLYARARDALATALERLEAAERLGRRLLDLHEFCPDCHGEPSGQYGHREDCRAWRQLYPDAAAALAAQEGK